MNVCTANVQDQALLQNVMSCQNWDSVCKEVRKIYTEATKQDIIDKLMDLSEDDGFLESQVIENVYAAWSTTGAHECTT